MIVFSNMVDMSTLNAFTVYLSNYLNDLGTRRPFLIQLEKQLEGIVDNDTTEAVTPIAGLFQMSERKRCYICSSKKDKKI